MVRITWCRKHGCGVGMCMSVPGCCSIKDDGHHFKTGVMVIIGIKWGGCSCGRASVDYI